MINFRAEMISDGLVEQFGKRPFNRALKPTLKEMLLFWHRRYAKRHFTWEAMGLYPEYRETYRHIAAVVRSPPRKQRKGQSYRHEHQIGEHLGEGPLVDTGSLRRHITKRKTMQDTSGTSRAATLKMGFGMPYRRKYEPAMMRRRAFSLMRREPGLTFKQALNKLYSKAGYDAKTKAYFQVLITAINEEEMRTIRDHGVDRLLLHLRKNKHPTKKRMS